MGYRLEHVAINCRNLEESVRFYKSYMAGKPTAIRKGSTGYSFCFVTIDGSPAIQLMESKGETGIHHYGFVVDDIEQVAADFKRKGAEIVRENRDADGRLTTIFVRDCNGLQMELRAAR